MSIALSLSRPPSPSGTSAGRAFFTLISLLRRTGPSAVPAPPAAPPAPTLGFLFRGPLGFFLGAARVAVVVVPPGETAGVVAAPGEAPGDFPAAGGAGGGGCGGGVAAPPPVGSLGRVLILFKPLASSARAAPAATRAYAGDAAAAAAAASIIIMTAE